MRSRTRSLAKYTSFDSYAYTDIQRTKYAWLQKSGGARTILMTKFVSHALYAVPRVRVQSEVYRCFSINYIVVEKLIYFTNSTQIVKLVY